MSFGAPALIPWFDYEPPTHRFTIPVVLPPDDDTKLTLEGFYSADGVAGDPVVLRCQIGTNSFSTQQLDLFATSAKDPRLEHLLSSMKEARLRLASGVERIQHTTFYGGEGSFRQIMANPATFQWQGTNQVFADISDIMNTKAFILGSDGKTCWLYSDDERNGPRLDSSPVAMVRDIYTSIADPFSLSRREVSAVIADDHPIYEGQAQFEGRTCHRLQCWIVRQPQGKYESVSAARMEWWIDAGTFLPVQLTHCGQFGYDIYDFHYENLNQRFPDAAFQPPAGPGIDAKPLLFKEAPAPDESRYFRIVDGCDGQMSGRIGRRGPTGQTGSGLN